MGSIVCPCITLLMGSPGRSGDPVPSPFERHPTGLMYAGHFAPDPRRQNPSLGAGTALTQRAHLRRASRLLKKGVGGVASAARPDARSRDEGDAGAHRRGAATPQTAPRRRNRLRCLAFCSRRFSREKSSLREVFLASRVAKGQTRHPYPFFSSLLVLGERDGAGLQIVHSSDHADGAGVEQFL